MKDFIKEKLNEYFIIERFSFNDGRFNKSGHNTIYLDDEAIVDLGVSDIGDIDVDGTIIPNAMYVVDYNAASQGKRYGTLGLKAIFDKLPKINNIIMQCFDTACPFWLKMGGEVVSKKDVGSGHPLYTININRNNFNN